MALHNLGFTPDRTLSGVPVVPGQLIAARPPLPGETTGIPKSTPDFLQKFLGIGEGSSLEQILKILSANPTFSGLSLGADAAGSGIGGLVGSILGLGKDN